MALKSAPYRCIWCLKDASSVAFYSRSHVLPECIGNVGQQVLPKGVVCDACNNYFGGELENRLIKEPILSTLVAILGLRDEDSQFTYEYSRSGVHRAAHITAEVSCNRIAVTTQYEIKGQPNKPSEARTIRKARSYGRTGLAYLSRAVHKIALESVAHNLFVGTGTKPQSKELGGIDLFDHHLDVVRDWVRKGKPQRLVRPVLRVLRLDEVERQEQLWEWGGKLGAFHGGTYYELNLFHDCYVVSLTSPGDQVKGHLVNWLEKRKPEGQVWMVADELQTIKSFKFGLD